MTFVERIFRPLTQGENYCTQHNYANDYKTDVDHVHMLHQSSKGGSSISNRRVCQDAIESPRSTASLICGQYRLTLIPGRHLLPPNLATVCRKHTASPLLLCNGRATKAAQPLQHSKLQIDGMTP